jgi:hypothetical protein
MKFISQVQPKHVKEAFRLLNKSIIRVEQPDIHLEEEEENEDVVIKLQSALINYLRLKIIQQLSPLIFLQTSYLIIILVSTPIILRLGLRKLSPFKII